MPAKAPTKVPPSPRSKRYAQALPANPMKSARCLPSRSTLTAERTAAANSARLDDHRRQPKPRRREVELRLHPYAVDDEEVLVGQDHQPADGKYQ